MLAGCYLPGEFAAEIRIDADTGAYEVRYEGELIDSGAPLRIGELPEDIV